MVARYIGDAQWTALDADTKPTNAAVADTLTTTNTRRRFIHQGAGVWVEIGTGTGGGPSTDVYKYFIYLDSADNKFKARNGRTGVIDYTSTGSTDAQPVINSAINASSNAPGKILFAGNTTFPCETTITGSPNRTLNLRSGLWLQGGGPSTIIQLKTGGGIIGFYGLEVNDVMISDLTIDGRNNDGTVGFSGQGGNIVFTAGAGNFCNRVWVERVKCLNSPEVGIKAKQTNFFHANFNHVEITALDAGVGYAGIQSTQGSGLCEMIGNTIVNPGGPAFGVNGQSAGNYQIIMVGNNCRVTTTSPILEKGRGQIHIEADAPNVDTDLLIADNTIWSNYFCVHVLGGKHIIISNNIFKHTGFESTALHAIDIERDTADDITVSNNKFYDIAENAINCDSPLGDISLINNTIINPSGKTANTYDGIRITAASAKTVSRLTVRGNRIRDSRAGSARMRHGIAIITTGSGVITNAVIEDNEIYGAVTSPMLESGTGLSRRPALTGYMTLIIGASGTSTTSVNSRYYSCFGALIANITESAVQATIPYRVRVKKMVAKLNTNGQDGVTVIRLRDDAANVTGASLTIPAGSTTEVASADIDTIIEAGSKICWNMDNSAVTTGSWVLSHCYALCQIEVL